MLFMRREWAAAQVSQDPTFFKSLENQQSPEFLWIGCSDSRVPVSNCYAAAGQAESTCIVDHQPPLHRAYCMEHVLSDIAIDVSCGIGNKDLPWWGLGLHSCGCNCIRRCCCWLQANQILGLAPGEIFVQRNVGNQASHTDMNCMSCMEYAVSALKVGGRAGQAAWLALLADRPAVT